jgi:hypothetical protein
MSTLSIVSMILNLSIIIGGFVYFLLRAMRHEKTKANN